MDNDLKTRVAAAKVRLLLAIYGHWCRTTRSAHFLGDEDQEAAMFAVRELIAEFKVTGSLHTDGKGASDLRLGSYGRREAQTLRKANPDWKTRSLPSVA